MSSSFGFYKGLADGSHSSTFANIAFRDSLSNFWIPVLSISKRLTATVVILSQITQLSVPKMGILMLHLFLSCSSVDEATTVTDPDKVLRYDRITTGLVFQSSGSSASLWNRHQKTCPILGAALIEGLILGGRLYSCVFISYLKFLFSRDIERYT